MFAEVTSFIRRFPGLALSGLVACFLLASTGCAGKGSPTAPTSAAASQPVDVMFTYIRPKFTNDNVPKTRPPTGVDIDSEYPDYTNVKEVAAQDDGLNTYTDPVPQIADGDHHIWVVDAAVADPRETSSSTSIHAGAVIYAQAMDSNGNPVGAKVLLNAVNYGLGQKANLRIRNGSVSTY